MQSPGPRLFGLTATEADVVAVLRRGPSDWCQVSRWDVSAGTIEHGSWFRGTIPPQKCDLSPDGRWLLYSAVKYPGRWEGGPVYEAVSRLPWLTALAAWEAGTTYTRGAHFVDERGRNDLGEPSVGTVQLGRWGLALTGAGQFAVERRRGWTESDDTPPRQAGGHWDENREVAMVRARPGGAAVLRVEGAQAAFRSLPSWYEGVLYSLIWPDEHQVLDGVQWADWSRGGQLLSADEAGVLRAHDLTGRALRQTQSHDLGPLTPDPQPPPAEARRW